jgi:hypothetical protein
MTPRRATASRERQYSLCPYTGDQQEGASRDRKHQERAKVVVLGLPSERVSPLRCAFRIVATGREVPCQL